MVGENTIFGTIGVRYARGCHPDDLWSKYFTSSSKVKTIRKNLGEPDVIEVRKEFDCKEKALEWEEKVLTRMGVLKDEKWLNSSIGGKKFFNFGIPRSEECRKKISEKRKQYISSLSDEDREKLAQRSREAGIKGAKKIRRESKSTIIRSEVLPKTSRRS